MPGRGRTRRPRRASTPPPARSPPPPRAKKAPGWPQGYDFDLVSLGRTRQQAGDWGGGGVRAGPVHDGGAGEVNDQVVVGGVTASEVEAGAEGDEGGEAEPPDPDPAVQGGGLQGGGETSGLVSGEAPPPPPTISLDIDEENNLPPPPVLHTADNKVLEAASYLPCLDESDSNNEETEVTPLTELEEQVVREEWAELEETVGRFLRESRREVGMNNTYHVIPTLPEQVNHTALTQQVITPLPEQNNHTAITQQVVTPLPEQNHNNFSHQQQATPPQQSLSPTPLLNLVLSQSQTPPEVVHGDSGYSQPGQLLHFRLNQPKLPLKKKLRSFLFPCQESCPPYRKSTALSSPPLPTYQRQPEDSGPKF